MIPQRISRRYRLHEQIGQGVRGTVWRAEDVEAGAWRAIKVLRPEYARDPAATAGVRDALLTFRHPNVVTLHDMTVLDGRLALVMDLVTEGDLDRFRRDRGGALPADLAAELMAQVCDGLAAAHAAGIVHRDLKPTNVLIDADRARVADLGTSLIGGMDAAAAAAMVGGPVCYSSPEALGGAAAGPADDVYAVGVTLFELMAGYQPVTEEVGATFQGRDIEPACPDGVPEPLWRLIAACRQKNPAARPTAAELATELRNPRLLAGSPSATESVVPAGWQPMTEAVAPPWPGTQVGGRPGEPPALTGLGPLPEPEPTPAGTGGGGLRGLVAPPEGDRDRGGRRGDRGPQNGQPTSSRATGGSGSPAAPGSSAAPSTGTATPTRAAAPTPSASPSTLSGKT
ncbi:MAG TPA: protein kinase, partial [Trebonia sp.]